MPIYLRGEDDELIPMKEEPYASEDLLQRLIAGFPELLAGDDDAPGRFLLISREMPTPDSDVSGGRWSLDHLFIDQQGTPTLVEVKRSTDTRLRREVVGQMLDYAANGVAYWPAGSLAEKFRAGCAEQGLNAEEVLADFLGAAGNDEIAAFWSEVESRLRAGQVRMLFVADAIPAELQRVVEFLNEQMSEAEVLGIEIRQYVAEDGRQTLVPRYVGRTARAQARKRGSLDTREWDKDSFLTAISDDLEVLAERFMQWGEQRGGRPVWGKGITRGSLQYQWDRDGDRIWPLSLITNGTILVPFGSLAKRPPFDDRGLRTEFATRLGAVEGVESVDSVDAYPEISVAGLRSSERVEDFITVLDWFLERADIRV